MLRAAQERSDAGRIRTVVGVSNEVGGGTVPDHPVARTFRDVHGWPISSWHARPGASSSWSRACQSP